MLIEDPNPESGSALTDGATRFELAPPRRFVLPAILLLLSEQAGYGYELVPRLRQLLFGHVDRPAVYRALAQLEADGLVDAAAQNPTAGPARRVFQVTTRGGLVLREWMSIIKEEADGLSNVLRRYQATGTTDSVLAEVGGGWATALGFGRSPVSSTSTLGGRHLGIVAGTAGTTDRAGRAGTTDRADRADRESPARRPGPASSSDAAGPERRRFRLVPDRSVVLVEVRSTAGPLSFGAIGVRGWAEAAVAGGVLHTDTAPSAHIEIDVAGLRSGNRVYDAELLRRIDARRYPTAVVELHGCEAIGPSSLYRLKGSLIFHGVTRAAQGTVTVVPASERVLVITGEEAFDIRDFSLPSPTVLMLRIFPDVRVRLHVEAEMEDMA
ncbi:MAG: helix-turn-helix transcriptional regulator [Acidimicrobiales bacterium]